MFKFIMFIFIWLWILFGFIYVSFLATFNNFNYKEYYKGEDFGMLIRPKSLWNETPSCNDIGELCYMFIGFCIFLALIVITIYVIFKAIIG